MKKSGYYPKLCRVISFFFAHLPGPLSVVGDAAAHDPLLADEPAAANVLVVGVGAERVEVPLSFGARVKLRQLVPLDRRDDVLAVLAHEAVAVLAAMRPPAAVRRQLSNVRKMKIGFSFQKEKSVR